jgi:hypothetical protein
MAEHFRALVTLWDSADPNPANRKTNTLHFRNNATVALTDYDALASDLATIYLGRTSLCGGCDRIQAKLYNLEDDEPRPVRGSSTKTVAKITMGPPELAVCLSFYAVQNIPRRRGRIYMGPIAAAKTGADRPDSALQNEVLGYATSFSALGGANIDWVILSLVDSVANGWNPRTGDGTPIVHQVTNAWVDNEWDVQRRRGYKSNTRVTASVTG